MARVGIIFGLLLCGLTVAALIGTATKVPAQFIPMMIGIPILFCGIVGLNPHRRKQSMHSAASIGVIGFVIGAGLAVYTGMHLSDGPGINGYVFKLVLAMSLLCLLFVATCAISFVQTRTRDASTGINE
ncbi:MAG: hypothetical protein HKN47_05915 [Pirellulaceae bacterium]|nr:hypothetical protein [Pirellulaceae bacterium]